MREGTRKEVHNFPYISTSGNQPITMQYVAVLITNIREPHHHTVLFKHICLFYAHHSCCHAAGSVAERCGTFKDSGLMLYLAEVQTHLERT